MIDTRLTRKFGLMHPVVLAPMEHAGGGRLAAAVASAGGLGLIGGGYCDDGWIEAQFELSGNEAVGCGFITWRLSQVPHVLDKVLSRRPRAIFLSYGDPRPFGERIANAGVPLICQVQDLKGAHEAVDAGAEVIVAQGNEAGGHGAERSTLTLVPELADYLYRHSHDTLLLAAGGIVDSRGLAASIVMGADGAVMGTRLWASQEALVDPNQIAAALKAGGDDTVRTRTIKTAQGLGWPAPYRMRVLAHAFTDRRSANSDDLSETPLENSAKWTETWESGDVTTGNAIVGQGIGIIHDAPHVREILETISTRAERLLCGAGRKVIP